MDTGVGRNTEVYLSTRKCYKFDLMLKIPYHISIYLYMYIHTSKSIKDPNPKSRQNPFPTLFLTQGKVPIYLSN